MSSSLRPGILIRQQRWEKRIRRARELRDQHSAFASALRLYEEVLAFQHSLASASSTVEFKSGAPLREQIDPEFAASYMSSILRLTVEHGPEALGREARLLEQEGEKRWRNIMETALIRASRAPGLNAIEDFFARACLQPIAENLQAYLPPDPNYSQHLCPACGGWAQLSVLHTEGEGASRWLLCSFCLREWLFRRVICPGCGEQDKEKLPRYSTELCAHVHVQACDTCKRYLKAVDMTIDGRAVPLVDEAALAVLDVWAGGQGYTKILPNLLGF